MSEFDGSTAGFAIQYVKKALERRSPVGPVQRMPQEIALRLRSSQPEYESLPGPSWIRLLRLERGSAGSVIRCSTRSVDLNLESSYTALSYTWMQDSNALQTYYSMIKATVKDIMPELVTSDILNDDKSFNYEHFDSKRFFPDIVETAETSTRSKFILCNDRPTKIQANLYEALKELRKSRPGEYWIDALCINQGDELEKTAQVKMMRCIYQRAKTVIVWLGTSSTLLIDGLPHLEHIANNNIQLPRIRAAVEAKNDYKWVLPPGSEIDARAMAKATYASFYATSSSWYTRIWVIQELICARHVIFAIGEAEVTEKTMLKAFELAHDLYRFLAEEEKAGPMLYSIFTMDFWSVITTQGESAGFEFST